MNCKQFNTIKLEEVLENLGHLPMKQNEKEAWYLNPFGDESQASFKLDKKQNIWFLHSEGIGGNNVDFMQQYLNATVKEVLDWVKNQHFFSFHPQNLIQEKKVLNQNYQITEIKELQNPNLKKYLQERGLSSNMYPYVKEIHFTINGKELYAIGFENISGGWELRNSFYKGALLKKDISIIELNNKYNHQNQKTISVFEGFMDALSFMEINRSYKGKILVMNSIALLNQTKEYLKNDFEIRLFLDNDQAGEKCKRELLRTFPKAKDNSGIYSDHKDLNDHLKKEINSIDHIKKDLKIVPKTDLRMKR